MEGEQKPLSRKSFLSWTAAIGALMAIPAFFRPGKKEPESKTVKMLTQDGKLVMVDVANITGKKKKIKPEEIHTWVNKRPNTN